MPSGCVGLADPIKHSFVVLVDVDAELVCPRKSWRVHVINMNGHEEDIVITLDMSVTWLPLRQLTEFLNGLLGVIGSIGADRVREILPKGLVARRKSGNHLCEVAG